MQQKEGFLSTDDGLRLHYQILGNGKNTIISPAASWLAADFEPLTQEHTIIFYDQRSRGQSDAVMDMEQIGIQHEVRDVETVRQHFGIEVFSLSHEWAESFPNARLLTIAGTGHYPWIEAPDTFFSATRQFMNGYWPPTAEDVQNVK